MSRPAPLTHVDSQTYPTHSGLFTGQDGGNTAEFIGRAVYVTVAGGRTHPCVGVTECVVITLGIHLTWCLHRRGGVFGLLRAVWRRGCAITRQVNHGRYTAHPSTIGTATSDARRDPTDRVVIPAV